MPTNDSNSNKQLQNESKPRIVINATDKGDLNGLRSDVDELSHQVNTAVGDLKKSITDIRDTVSEMENPFKSLKTDNIPSEKNESDRYPGVKSIVLENIDDDKELSLALQKLEPPPQKQQVIPKELAPTAPPIVQSSPIRASVYLDWIWGLLEDGLTAENIRQFANLCEMTNYLPKQANEFIYALAVTAEKIRSIGFTKAHLLLFVSKAASLSKTNIDPEDMKALLDLTEKQLKSQRNE